MTEERGKLEYVPCNLCKGDAYQLLYKVNSWNIVECNQCRLVYVNPRPKAIAIEDIYRSSPDQREHYERKLREDTLIFERTLKRIEKYSKVANILDIGCGAGTFLRIAKKHGWKPYGIELAHWACQLLESSGIHVLQGTVEETHYPDAFFQVVFMSSALEHLPNPLRTLREAFRILKKGGLLAITGIPNINSLTIRLGIDNWTDNNPPGHLYYFSHKTLSKMLAKTGFEAITLTTGGVCPDFFTAFLGSSNAANTLDQLRREVFLKRSLRSETLNRILYSFKPVANFFLNLLRMGATIEIYARKR